jgi:pentatricopeptide repeat protein
LTSLWQRARLLGISANRRIYRALMVGYATQKDGPSMLKAYTDMKKRVSPGLPTMHTLLHCCGRMGRPDLLQLMFQLMEKEGVSPTQATLSAVARTIGKDGELSHFTSSLRYFSGVKISAEQQGILFSLLKMCNRCLEGLGQPPTPKPERASLLAVKSSFHRLSKAVSGETKAHVGQILQFLGGIK